MRDHSRADEHVQPSEHSTLPNCPISRSYGEEWINLSNRDLDHCLLHSLDWSEDNLSTCFASIYLANQVNTDPVTQEMVDWHRLTLVAKAT